MKIKACELMTSIVREPEKYEGKRYRVVGGSKLYACPTEHRFDECRVKGGELLPIGHSYGLFATVDTILEEIRQPIPFMDAVKAYADGKTIRCECDNTVWICKPDGQWSYGKDMGRWMPMFIQPTGMRNNISTGMIFNGRWFIELEV